MLCWKWRGFYSAMLDSDGFSEDEDSESESDLN